MVRRINVFEPSTYSVSFTKDRYAHLFPEHGEALADRLDRFMTTATPTPAAPVVRPA